MKRQFLNKKTSSYLSVYDDYRKRYTGSYETEYYKVRENFSETVGLPYNFISSGDYDPTVITTPLPTLANVIAPTVYTINAFTIGTWTNVAYNDPLVWGIDRYYIFNVTSNGNSYKLGFYGGDAPLSSATATSIYPPDFYYESTTGNVYMGNVLLKNIGANLPTIMIRVDSNFNFYVGTANNHYWLIGNCLTDLNIINIDTYTLRLGFEVNSLTTGDTVFDLIDGQYSNLINIATEGVTWPNYRFGGSLNSGRFSIADTLHQSNTVYNVYPIRNYSNDVTSLGQRCSFTLQCLGLELDQIVIFITPTLLSQSTYIRSWDIVSELALEFVVYDSLTNGIAVPQLSISTTLPSFPDLNHTNGQIYFRIEEDGKIYASKDKSTATLICTRTYPKFYIYIVTKGFSGAKQCDYTFIQHNIKPIAPNPPPVPNILSMPMINKTASIFLPNGNNSDSFPMTAGKFYTTNVDSSPPLPYGLSRWYSIDLNNVTNDFKIGFYCNSLINNHTETLSSVNPPQFYYSTSDKGVYMGGVLKKTLPYNWSVIFLLVDEALNFYVGYGQSYYFLIDNITNYIANIFPDTYTIRLGWEVHANSSSTYNLTNIDGGYYQPPSYKLTWPNNRLWDTSLSDYSYTATLTNIANSFKFINFLNYSNSYSQQGSFTLQNLNTATNSEIIVVLFTDVAIPNNTSNSTYTAYLTGNYLIYKHSTNQFIYNGTILANPNSYPDLNTALGQIYWEYNGSQILVSRDSSNKVVLAGVSSPVGTIYGGIMTSSTTNSSSTYTFIADNTQAIVPPPGPPLPVPVGSTIPAPSGSYSSKITTGTAQFGLTFSGLTINTEYLLFSKGAYQQLYADKWQSTLVLNFTTTDHKIGVGFKSTTPIRSDLHSNATPTLQWSANCYLYYYYDASNGNVYKDGVAIYSLSSGIQTIGFAVDENYNVYVVTATDYYNVGSFSTYLNINSNIQTGLSYGWTLKPSTTSGNYSTYFALNTSRSYIYTTIGNSVFSLDGIYNRILWDSISSLYKTSITASSSANYKFIECKLLEGIPLYNWRYMFKFTIAPQDVVLLWGWNDGFTPGAEYNLSQIQSVNPSIGCITYVSSTSTFYANSTSRHVSNLNLSVNNTTLYFDQIDGQTSFNAGSNYTSRQNIPVGIGLVPLTTIQTSMWQFPFRGFLIKTASPSTYCQIDVIAIA